MGRRRECSEAHGSDDVARWQTMGIKEGAAPEVPSAHSSTMDRKERKGDKPQRSPGPKSQRQPSPKPETTNRTK